ncbi:MAG: hypothetical protein EAZ08_04105 [Cytophagales bacterium]|nr:MAG: hypothetical protein EAZ08_04105 [Cytophagales bacterium]
MCKKLTLLFPLFFACYIQCIAQKQTVIDSLLYQLSATKEDTIKVNIITDIVYEYASYDTKKAMEYGNLSLEIAKKINYTYGIALSLRNISYIYYVESNYAQCLKYAFDAIEKTRNTNYLQIKSACLGIVGNVYFMQQDYDKAKVYYEQSLEVAQIKTNNNTISAAMNRLGKLYVEQKKYTEAIEILTKSLKIAKQFNRKDRQGDCLLFLGRAYYSQKEYGKALSFFYQSLQANKTQEDIVLTTNVLKSIAKIHQVMGQLDSAIIYGKEALKSVSLTNSKHQMLQIHEVMYLTYKSKKDINTALYHHEQMLVLKDSIYNKDKINAVAGLQANYEIKEKQYEIEKQNITIRLNAKIIAEERMAKYGLGIGFTMLCIFGYILYYNYRKIKKTNLIVISQNAYIQEQRERLQAINEELNQQNEEMSLLNNNLEKVVNERTHELKLTIESLSKQNQDLEQFSYIISHNLRAPVARILGLTNIFDKDEILSQSNQEIFTHLQKTTIDLDEVIKDLTYIISIRKDFTSVKEIINLEEKICVVLNYFSEQIESKDITIQYNLQVDTFVSIKSYIQSILFHLISNAIKYQSKKRKLVITIDSILVNDLVCIAIHDNGIGIDLTNLDQYKIFGLYQRMHDHVEGKGLGLYLVKTQVEFLNGTIEIKSKLDVGTTLKVYLP